MTVANKIFQNITGSSIEQLTGVNPRTALHPGVILDKILHTVPTDSRFFVTDVGNRENYVPTVTESTQLTKELLSLLQNQMTIMYQAPRSLGY